MQAGKATISLMSAVFTSNLLLTLLGQPALLPSILSGMAGLIGIMVVMDDTKKKKQVTTWLLGASAICGVTLGSLLANNVILVSSLMVVVIFCAFYFSRFGSRYFSIGMIGFMTVYLSSFLKLSPAQFPWFYITILIGISYAYLYNFILFKDTATVLRRSMRSFHKQANLTFELFIEVIEEPETSEARRKKLVLNVRKLREYATNVSADVQAQEIRDIWPGLEPRQLKLYVFDTAMLVATLSDSLQQLKEDQAFEMKEIRTLLIRVITLLKKAEVLNDRVENYSLEEAEKVMASLRTLTEDLFGRTETEDWHYIIRRIEAMVSHVTEGATAVKASIRSGGKIDDKIEAEEEETETAEEEGMKPTTKKAIQSLIAGSIAIVVGYLISPIQPYWVLLTTFIVQLGTETVGRTYLKGFERSVGTVIGAVIGFVVARLVSGQSELEIALIFIVVFLAFYLLTVSYTLMSLFITMLIAFMYDLLLGGISYELLGARVIDTIAGAAIALGVSAYIYPTKTMDKVSDTLIDYLDELDVYVKAYLESLQQSTPVKPLAEHGFALDEKLQTLEAEAKPILQGPGGRKYSGLPSRVTLFTALNYYAKHLVASSYEKDFRYPEDVHQWLQQVEEKFSENIQVIKESIEQEQPIPPLHDLQEERKQLERHAPTRDKGQGDLVHHLYYIWKMNQTFRLLNSPAVETKEKDH